MTSPEMNETATDLLRESMETLERTGCEFFACPGPTIDPEPMLSCFRCLTLGRLRAFLGLPVILLEETKEYAEAQGIIKIAGYSGRRVSLDQALTQVRNHELCQQYGYDPDRYKTTA
jgi:hypothetical protein